MLRNSLAMQVAPHSGIASPRLVCVSGDLQARVPTQHKRNQSINQSLHAATTATGCMPHVLHEQMAVWVTESRSSFDNDESLAELGCQVGSDRTWVFLLADFVMECRALRLQSYCSERSSCHRPTCEYYHWCVPIWGYGVPGVWWVP
jgi:hypothetical protein